MLLWFQITDSLFLEPRLQLARIIEILESWQSHYTSFVCLFACFLVVTNYCALFIYERAMMSDTWGDNVRLWTPDGKKNWRAFLEAGYQSCRTSPQLRFILLSLWHEAWEIQLQGEGRLILVHSFKKISAPSLASPLWAEHHCRQNMADQSSSPMESGTAPPYNPTPYWTLSSELQTRI